MACDARKTISLAIFTAFAQANQLRCKLLTSLYWMMRTGMLRSRRYFLHSAIEYSRK